MGSYLSQDIDVGQFRSRPTFLNNAPVANNSGGFIDNYVAFLTCWGKLRQNNGSRNLITGEIELNNTFTLTVRYQDALALNLKSNTQVTIDSRTFTIESTTKIEELDFFYSFQLKQKDH